MSLSSFGRPLLRNVSSVVLMVLMTLAADLLAQPEVYFPEVGALCVGLWVMDKRVWTVRRWQIPVLFTLAAAVGVGLASLPFYLPLKLLAAFLFVAVLMMLMRVSMLPALSACMLPVLMGTSSWVYPVAVSVLTSVLAVGQSAMERWGWRTPLPAGSVLSRPPSPWPQLLRWLLFSAILLPFAVLLQSLSHVPALAFCRLAMVPPLVVTLVEFGSSASGFRRRPVRTWLLIVLCAAMGTCCEGLLHLGAGLPQAAAVGADALLVLLFFAWRRRFFAPAMALSLVPMMVAAHFGPTAVAVYPLYVAVGAAYFIFMAKVCFPRGASL